MILDVATLTGHMVAALGDKVGGVMGDPDVVDAGARRGHGRRRGQLADADPRAHGRPASTAARSPTWRSTTGSAGAAALFAAAFLREFTGGIPWAHLDIAGPAFNAGGPAGHVTSGGTGFAVTTLVEFARSLCRLAFDPARALRRVNA